MDWQPKRGDVVKYRGRLYFFQSNGTSCYLYEYRDIVGLVARSSCQTSRANISRPNEGAARFYARTHQFAPRAHFADFNEPHDDVVELSESSEEAEPREDI